MAILEVRGLKKVYSARLGGDKVHALTGVSFSVEAGEFVAIMGESGSGKTTLLNIIASFDKPTSGDVLLEGKSLLEIPDDKLAAFRREKLGFVFQDFNLLDTFTLRDNIFLPLVLAGVDHLEMARRITPIARSLGIEDILGKYPYEVSGGQKQRAAIARALITNPTLLLADEPTGALDSKAATALLQLFDSLNKGGQTIFLVTHSANAASYASRVLFIKDGQVFQQIYRAGRDRQRMQQEIADTLRLLSGGGQA